MGLYCREISSTRSYKLLVDIFRNGDVAIFDIGGYDYKDLGMNPENTTRDLNHSWGHGLLLSLMLEGIDPRNLGQ